MEVRSNQGEDLVTLDWINSVWMKKREKLNLVHKCSRIPNPLDDFPRKRDLKEYTSIVWECSTQSAQQNYSKDHIRNVKFHDKKICAKSKSLNGEWDMKNDPQIS